MALPTRAEAEAALPDADADMGGVGSSGNTRHANMLNSSSSSSSSSSCPKWRMESGERRVCREWKTPLKLIMLLKSMTDYDDDDCAQDLDLVFGFCFCFSAFFSPLFD